MVDNPNPTQIQSTAVNQTNANPISTCPDPTQTSSLPTSSIPIGPNTQTRPDLARYPYGMPGYDPDSFTRTDPNPFGIPAIAKLIVLLFAFAFLLLVANASIYRTTVDVEEENSSRGQSCQQQFEQQQRFRHFPMCMQQEIKGSQGGRWLSTDVNQRQQCFRQCCQELKEVDRRCRCQNLEQMVRHPSNRNNSG
ncbi:hypothetical protein Patl1_04296 [Pistacia atlantica]|uniref:Uncharacterized protein n=1 Tax=Pistacia atlantica TaxID=434234 RepID=A0ACC1BTQ3_9ROSI|nr:hypothetical protein Patl1_04296 [Pistacia atlantica]